MIRLGLRLTLGSGREAALRVLVTAAAVALGVGLLLASWPESTGSTPRPTVVHGSTPRRRRHVPTLDIRRAVVAVEHRPVRQSGDRSSRPRRRRTERSGPAGDSASAGPGEYYASPALTTLLRSEPANELRDRYPGRQIGTIGAAALPSPNSLDRRHRPYRPPALAGHPVRSRSEPFNARRPAATPARAPSGADPFCSSSWPAEPLRSCCQC